MGLNLYQYDEAHCSINKNSIRLTAAVAESQLLLNPVVAAILFHMYSYIRATKSPF